MKVAPLLLVTILALAGCAANPNAIRVQYLGAAHQYAPAPFVEVMESAPDQPYTSIARLTFKAGPALDSAQVIEALKQRAASLGANALIVQRRQSSTDQLPGITINPAGGQYALSANKGEETYIGTAIHVHDLDNDKTGLPQ
ncbi:hypothetical protein [Acidiphilium sp. PM]|uniref:hypothetical protein n=1 Tax=Acidiphilium sp. PM TaxID=1043206 RepID=UPI00110FD26A|nr:hypothetical protein [Acidiphilium sp. PM]